MLVYYFYLPSLLRCSSYNDQVDKYICTYVCTYILRTLFALSTIDLLTYPRKKDEKEKSKIERKIKVDEEKEQWPRTKKGSTTC